jgi:hypothetical protein
MPNKTHRWIARLAMPIALALAGCPPPDHGDEGDDDTVAGDDDSAAGDDDDMVGDDDDATGDDDDMTDYGPRTDDGAAPYHPVFDE